MAIVHIDKLGTGGIVFDIAPYNLKPEQWSAAQNVKFHDGVEKAGTYIITGDTPVVSPIFFMPWLTNTDAFWFYGSTSKLRLWSVSADIDVTRTTGGDYNATGANRYWTGGVLGGVPIVNNNSGADYPQSWNGTTIKFEDLPNWPSNVYCDVIRPYKQFLIAMGIKEGSDYYPTKLRWSTPADPGTIPASWDISDPTNDAGEYSISETTGAILDCVSLGDMNVIYKEDSIWFQRLSGNYFVFQSGGLFKNVGLIASGAVAEFNKKHIFLSYNDIYVHDGQSLQTIATKRIRDTVFNVLDEEYYRRIRVVKAPHLPEIWFCLPEVGTNGKLTVAYIWNWESDSWGTCDLPELGGIDTGITNSTGVPQLWDAQAYSWQSANRTWDERKFSAIQHRLFGIGDDEFYQLNWGTSHENNPIPSYVERTGLAITGRDQYGEWKTNVNTFKQCIAVYPHIEAQEGMTFTIRVGGQNAYNDPVTWETTKTFTVGVDTKVDCTATFRLLAIRIENNSGEAWNLHGYELDLNEVGRF